MAICSGERFGSFAEFDNLLRQFQHTNSHVVMYTETKTCSLLQPDIRIHQLTTTIHFKFSASAGGVGEMRGIEPWIYNSLDRTVLLRCMEEMGL